MIESNDFMKNQMLHPLYFFIRALVFVNVKIQWNQILIQTNEKCKIFDQKYFRESFYETNIYIFEVFLRFFHFMAKITLETTEISEIVQNFPFLIKIDHL